VVKYRPWWISVAGFWLPAMANFVKDDGAMTLYLEMAAPHTRKYIFLMIFTK
jgi:hypothetical protein